MRERERVFQVSLSSFAFLTAMKLHFVALCFFSHFIEKGICYGRTYTFFLSSPAWLTRNAIFLDSFVLFFVRSEFFFF